MCPLEGFCSRPSTLLLHTLVIIEYCVNEGSSEVTETRLTRTTCQLSGEKGNVKTLMFRKKAGNIHCYMLLVISRIEVTPT